MQCPECGSTWERSCDCKTVEQPYQGTRICSRCEEDLVPTKDVKGLHSEFLAQIVSALDVEDSVTIGADIDE